MQLIIVEEEGKEPIIGEMLNCLTKEETKECGTFGQLVQIRRLDNRAIEDFSYGWRFATFEDLHSYVKRTH